MTDQQEAVFDEWDSDRSLLIHGNAGTGKTFIATYLALRTILEDGLESPNGRLIIVRSIVPSRDVGFLPGTLKEKAAVYEAPYVGHFQEMFGRDDAYTYLKDRGIVEFTTTSFERGITFRNCIVLVDEVQNMAAHELNTVITRVGENCRIIFCGDVKQTDLNGRERSGLNDFIKILRAMRSFGCIEMGLDDIVRSGMVREYYQVRDLLERNNEISSLGAA